MGTPRPAAGAVARDVGRDRAVRRNTVLLAVAEPAVRAVLTLMFTVGSVAVFRFSGRATWTGAFTAVTFGLTAAAAAIAGRAMDRFGRRPGLAGGHLLLVVASLVAALAVAARSTLGLVAAGGLFGAGSGAANLGRGAVADMYPPERRGRAVGILLAAGTLGAVGGPALAGLLQRGAHHGGEPLLPWAVTAVLGAIGLASVLALRPDPRDLAFAPRFPAPGRSRVSPVALLRMAPFRAAVAAIVLAHASMVAVMGVTPVVLHTHGGGGLAIGVTLSLHVTGMFAFAPLIGAAIDRWGRKRGLLAGGVTAAAGAVVASASANTVVVAGGVFAVGLGWSAAFLSSTAAISDLTRAEERAGALGFTDLLANVAAAAGGLLGGILLDTAGFWLVGLIMAVLFVVPLVLVLGLREPTPGSWAGAAAA